MISNKIFVILCNWPRWCFLLIVGKRWRIIEEMRGLGGEGKRTPVRKTSNVNSRFDRYGGTRGFPGLDAPYVDITVIIAVLACALLGLRTILPPLMVDRFVRTMVTLSSVALVIGFLMGVTGKLDFSKKTRKAIARDLVIVSTFLLSTVPFTLPWLLAYFFPFEFLLFAMIFAFSCHTIAVLSKGFTHQKHVVHTASPMPRDRLVEFLASRQSKEYCQAFIVLESGVVFCAVVMSFIWETLLLGKFDMNGNTSWQIMYLVVFFGVASACTFAQAFWLTYAAGGQWLYFNAGWKFFQPFKGGLKFVILQVAAWSLYGVCVSLSFYRLAKPITEAVSSAFQIQVDPAIGVTVDYVLTHLGVIARVTGIDGLPPGTIAVLYAMADVFLVLSLFQYQESKLYVKPQERSLRVPPHGAIASYGPVDPGGVVETIKTVFRASVLAFMLFAMVKPEVVLMLTSITINQHIHGGASVLAVYFTIVALYIPTYLGNPSVTGCRRQKMSEKSSLLVRFAEQHYQLMTVRAGKKFSQTEGSKYFFGYHPHGLVPGFAAALKNTGQFQELLPGLRPATLTATITHQIPILRDMNQLSGSLEVTPRGFWSGLKRFGSVMVVPGGQHEMLLAVEQEHGVERISTKHRGFVRLALIRAALFPKESVYLVPVFAFGERNTLINLPLIPLWIQEWFVARLRSNVAFFPVGRWYLPCLPARGPVTCVIGERIKVPALKKGTFPTKEQVILLHRKYYSQVEKLFDTYKAQHGGEYTNATLAFEPSLDTLTDEEFEKEWEKLAGDSEKGDLEKFNRQTSEQVYVWPWQEQLIVVFIVVFFVFGPYSYFHL